MLEFLSLASSSAGCCYRVSGGGTSAALLIECGIRFPRIREALDFKVTQLAGCLISHAHGDHCLATGEMMKAGVDCYAHPETWGLLRYEGLHRSHDLVPQREQSVGDWTVLPFEVPHDCVGCLGFLIGAPSGERLLYLTDAMFSPFRFAGLTHLAVEANHSLEQMRANVAAGVIDRERYRRTAKTHMSIERLIEMLRRNDLSRVQEIWLLHLSDANSNAEGFKDQVQRATGCVTRVAPA